METWQFPLEISIVKPLFEGAYQINYITE